MVQTSSQVMCDSCQRSVSSFQGFLISESGQSQFKRGQFIRTGCLMMTGVESWESREGNKPGQLRKDCSVYKKRIAEKGNKPKGERVETTAVVQGSDGRNVGGMMMAMLIGRRFGDVSDLTTRGTTPPLSPISEYLIEQVSTRTYTGKTWTQYVGRVESVVSCHECFEFATKWDIGRVHRLLRFESTIFRSFIAD